MKEIICNTENCTGCGACYSSCRHSAISMKESEEGFLYPEIDCSLCVDCGLCSKVCPENNPVQRHSECKVYAAWSLDDEIRRSSSSGGIFVSLAKYVIENGGVVFGAVWKDTVEVVHTYADSLEGLKPMQGSKYIQSELGDSYAKTLKFLTEGRMVMFTGTPCQVGGLLKFLGQKAYDNLLTVELVCHGVPSKFAFKSYVKKIQKKYGKVDKDSFSFRDTEHWTANTRARIDGTITSFWGIDDLYYKMYRDNFILRESCYTCSYTFIQRCADITIGDFWRIGKDIPFDFDTNSGCSLVLVNSPAGYVFWENISETLFLEERTVDEAVEGNRMLQFPARRPENRNIIYQYLFRNSIDRTYYFLYSTKKNYFMHRLHQLFRCIMKPFKFAK